MADASGVAPSKKSLEKAFLEIIYSSKRAGDTVACMFNPETLSVTRSNSWNAPKGPGKRVQTAKFEGSGSSTMSLELWFDTTDTGKPVTDFTGKIMGLLDLDTKVPGTNARTNNARPPVVKFHWGTLVSFPAVITQAKLDFNYFSSAGVPLRAKVNLDLMQFRDDKAFGPQNPTSGTPFPHRVHRTLPGETLDRISAHYYGDSTKWRALAGANGIEDPLAIRPGSLLVIPEITSL